MVLKLLSEIPNNLHASDLVVVILRAALIIASLIKLGNFFHKKRPCSFPELDLAASSSLSAII